jgi:hypothetical protein
LASVSASKLAISARRSSSGKAATLKRPAYKRSSWRSGQRVEVDATNTLLGTRALHPTKQDLGGTRIGDSPLA